MRLPRVAPLLVTLTIAAPATSAKPMFRHVSGELSRAALVAEVQVIGAKTAGWGESDGQLTIRVTSDPAKIALGHEYLGETLRIPGAPGGASVSTHEFAGWAGATDVLLVLQQGDLAPVLGGRKGKDGTWEIHGWCDFNACLLGSDEGTGVAAERGGIHGELWRATPAQVRQMTAWSRNAAHARTLQVLAGEPNPRTESAIYDLVARMAHGTTAMNGETHRALVDGAYLNTRALLAARDGLTEGPHRERVDQVVAELAPWIAAARAAEAIAPLDDETILVTLHEASIAALDPATHRRITTWLDGRGDR